MHLLIKFGRKSFVLLNAKLTLIKGGGHKLKKFLYLCQAGSPGTSTSFSAARRCESWGVRHTNTAATTRAELGRQPCFS